MTLEPTVHVPVLIQEVLEWSDLGPGQTVVDGTLGGGGHARAIYDRIAPGGQLIAIDRDPAALLRFEDSWKLSPPEKSKLSPSTSVKLIQGSYLELPAILAQLELSSVQRVLLDLGLSSDQLTDYQRGFSFRLGGPLDLRFDPETGYSAAELLSWVREEELANLIYKYGEERFSRRIARSIVERRRTSPIQTAEQLADLVHRCIPGGNIPGRIDSATRTFQALRIAVNDELQHLEKALQVIPELLSEGGRLLVISFHSLEDRLVKNAFRDHPLLQPMTKKPIEPSERETRNNPRARSARLRVASRVANSEK